MADVTMADRILAAVSNDPEVSVEASAVAATLKAKPREFAAGVAEAEASGFLTRWAAGDVVLLTLTPHTAQALGLVPDPESDRWRRRADRPERRDYTLGRRKHEIRATDLWDTSEMSLDAIATRDDPHRGDAYPRHLVGVGRPMTAHPDPKIPCLGCDDRQLDATEYCLHCSRPLGTSTIKAKAGAKRREQAQATRLAEKAAAKEADRVMRARRKAKAEAPALADGVHDAVRGIEPRFRVGSPFLSGSAGKLPLPGHPFGYLEGHER